MPCRRNYPTLGQSDRVEILGSDGTMIIDDDHLDHLLYSDKGIPHAYVPDHDVNMAFLGSNTAGDWAVGDFWGPLGNETRAWLDPLVTGHPTVHTTPEEARINLETTLAIERAVTTGQSVRLPLQSEFEAVMTCVIADGGTSTRFLCGRRDSSQQWRTSRRSPRHTTLR